MELDQYPDISTRVKASCHLLLRWFLFGVFFDPEDEGDKFLQNCIALYPRKQFSA
jgi:hypothetical protein